jgi:hypothetical protein
MYIAYSNSYETTNGRTIKPAQHTHGFITLRPKKTIRFFITLIVLTFVFSFGAFVQAYAGDTASTVSNNTAVTSGSSNNNHSSTSPAPAVKKIIVDNGDTLWDIAAMHVSKGQNVRSYITNIKKINGLSSSSINAGDVLILP